MTQIGYADAVSVRPAFPAVSPKHSIDEIVHDPSKLSIPFDYSHIENFYTGNTDRLIIHIQDPHANFSGQKNLSETLRYLMREYPVSDVLVEGSSENVTLSGVRESFSGKDLKKTADKLLFYGIISGEEHLNLTSSAEMNLLGIEDENLYQANLRSYRTVIEKRESTLAYIKQLKRASDHLKKSLYPETLLTYEQIPEEEFMNRISDMQRLYEDAGLQISAYPEIKKYNALKTLESEIDFDELNRELIYLIGALNADLKDMPQSASQSEQLVWTVQLKETAEMTGIETGGLETLNQYIDYLREFIKLDFKKLTEETDAAEEKICALLLDDQDSRVLHSIDRYLDLLEKGYLIRMTSADTEIYNLSRQDFDTKSIVAFFNRKLAELGHYDSLVEFSPVLDDSGSIIKDFYALVNSRDEAFIRNILKSFEGDPSKVKFLISGGYHTRHISKLLRDAGISYVTLSPIITDQTNHADYEKLLFAGLKPQTADGEVVSAVRQAGAQTAGWERYLMLRQAGARLGEDSENLMRSIAGFDGIRVPDDQSRQNKKIKILRNGTKDPGTATPGSLVLTDEEINYLVGHIPGISKAVLHIKFNTTSVYFELEGMDRADYAFLNIQMLHSPREDRVVLGAGEFKKKFVRLYLKGDYEDAESVVRQIESEFWRRLKKILSERQFKKLIGPSLPSRVEPYFTAMGFVRDTENEPFLYLPLAETETFRDAGADRQRQGKVDIRVPIEPYEGTYYPEQISVNIDRIVRAVLEVENRGNQPVNVLNIGSESNIIRPLSPNINPVNVDQREMPIPSRHAGVNFVMANLFSGNFMEEIERSNVLRPDAENILLFHNMKSFFSLYGSMTSGMPVLGFDPGFWTDLYVRGIERLKPASYLIFFEHDSPTSGFGLNPEETFLRQTEQYFQKKNPAAEFRIYDQEGKFAAYVVRLKPPTKPALPEDGSRLSAYPERTARGQSSALGPDNFSYIMVRTLTNISGTNDYQDNSSYDGVFYTRIFRMGDYSAKPISDLIRKTIRTKGHAVVVDVGAGRQSALIQAKQMFGESIRTIAADVKNHLEGMDDNYYQSLGKRFGRTVKKEHLPEFVSGSMETIQLPERPDILLSVYSMPYVPDPLLGFENLYNQLTPGGIFAGMYFASQFKNFKPIGKSIEQERDWLEMVIRELESRGLIDGKIGAGAFFIRKKTDQKIRVNLIRDESLRKLQRSSEGQVHGDYRIENPGQPIVIIENKEKSLPNITIKKSKKKKKINSGKPGASKNLGARLAGDWKDAVRRELESYGWAPQTIDRLFEEQHVEQLGRDAGFYLDSHMRVQSELLRKDFDSYIKRRIESDDRRVRFAVFGIGKSPQEIADVLNIFYTTLESNGEVPADWKVHVDAFDKNDLFVEIASEDYFDPENIDFMLSKIGLSRSQYKRGMFELKAHLADVSDYESLSRIVNDSMKGEKADYTLFRNVTYTNREIESIRGDFEQMPDLRRPGLSGNYRSVSNLLYHYHSVRNTLLAAAKNGAKYIIDPGLIYRHADDLYRGQRSGKLVIDDGNSIVMTEPGEEFSGRSFAFPGLRVVSFGELTGDTETVRSNAFEKSTGIYEVEDLGLITDLESQSSALETTIQMIADTKSGIDTASRLSSPVIKPGDPVSASRLSHNTAIRSNELNDFELLLRKHHVNTTSQAIETSIRNGADVETIQLWFDALFPSKSFKFPERFFVHPETLRNWIVATLDSLHGFKDARENADWKKAAEIYRENVLTYPVAAGKKGSPQTHFFQNESGLFVSRIIRKDYMFYLRETEPNSKNSMLKLIKFALPELLGSYPLLLESEVEKGAVDQRKFISEDLLKSAFEGEDENSIQSLIQDYGTPEKGVIVVPTSRKIRQYPRIHFFTNKSGKDVHLYHPEKVSEPLDVWFEKKQGILFVAVKEHASGTFLYRAKYDEELGRFVFGAEYVMKWFEGVKGYPFIDDPVLIERQEDNAAHNYYFGTASTGKTVNLGRDMITRTEAVHSDSSLSTLVVRPYREGKVKKIYAYMTFNQKDPESAVGSWTWKPRTKQLDVDYFLPFGTGAWFESFITKGIPDPMQRYYKRLDLNDHGEGNVFRYLKLRVGDLYRGNIAQMPSQVLMVSSSEKHRVDVHYSNDQFSERGTWTETNQSPYLTSRFYDERQKLFIRPWQELSRRLEAKINDPETILTNSGIMMQAPSYGRTRLAVIQEHSVELEYALTANQYLWVQPAEIISGENSHTGIQVFLLDDKWNPEFHIRDGYWDRESSAWVWVSESHAEKTDQQTHKNIRTQLQRLDYRPMDTSDELKDDQKDSASEDKPEIEPEVLDRFIEAAIQKLREDFEQDTLLRIDDSMIQNVTVELSGLPDDEDSKHFIGKRLSANSALGEAAGSLVVDSMIRQFWDFVSTPSFEESEAEVLAEEIRAYIVQNQLSTLPLKSIMDYISGARLTETIKPLNSRTLNSGARMSENLDYYLSQISTAAIQAEQYLRRLNEDNHLRIEKSLAAPSVIMGHVRTLRASRSEENPELFEFFLKRLDTMINIAEQSIDSFHQALQQQDAAFDDRKIRQEAIGDQGVLRVVSDKIRELREEYPVVIALGSAAYIANEINQYLNRIQPLIDPSRYDILQTILSNPRELGIQQSLSKLSGPEREFVTLMTAVQWLDDLKAWGATRNSFRGKSERRILDQLESFSVEIARYIGSRKPDAGADFNQGQPLKAGQILEHLNSIQRILRYLINQTESGARLTESEESGARLADTPLSEEDNPVADSEKPSGSVQIQGDQIRIEKYTEEGAWQQSFKFEKFGEVGSVLQTQISLQQTGADPAKYENDDTETGSRLSASEDENNHENIHLYREGIRPGADYVAAEVPIRDVLEQVFSVSALNPEMTPEILESGQIVVRHNISGSMRIVLKILPLWGAPWISDKLSEERRQDYGRKKKRTAEEVLILEVGGYLEDLFLETVDNAASGGGIEWNYQIPIEIQSRLEQNQLIINVRDGGEGLPDKVIQEVLFGSYQDPWLSDLQGFSTKQILEPDLDHNRGIKTIVRYAQALGGRAEIRTVIKKDNQLIQYSRVFVPGASATEQVISDPDIRTGTEWTVRIPFYSPDILNSESNADDASAKKDSSAARLADSDFKTRLPDRLVAPNELDEERIALAGLYLQDVSYLGSSEDAEGYIRFNGNTIYLPDGGIKKINADPERLVKIRMKIQSGQKTTARSPLFSFEAALGESLARFRQGLRVLAGMNEEGVRKFSLLSDVSGFADSMDANLQLLYQLERENRFTKFYTQTFIGETDEVKALEQHRLEISRSENTDPGYLEFINRIHIVSLNQILDEYRQNPAAEKPRLVYAGQAELFGEYAVSSAEFKSLIDKGMISIVPVQKAQRGELLDALNQFVSGAILTQWSQLSANQKTKYAEEVSNYFRQTFRIPADTSQIDDLAHASGKKISWYQKISLPVVGKFISQIFDQFKIRLRSVDISA